MSSNLAPRSTCHLRTRIAASALAAALCVAAGCRTTGAHSTAPPEIDVPRELQKTTLPTYRIEMPDVLLIDAVQIIPKNPYDVELLDMLQVVVSGTPDDQPINGVFRVDSGGDVALGPGYGKVKVLGKTLEEAEVAVHDHLAEILASPEVAISLSEPAARQAIAGEHVVAQDGTVNLGVYGTVRVVGLTVRQAKEAIEDQLSEYLQDPEIAVDIRSLSSKVYYVILQGGGEGDQITRLPITGNETVLDAVSLVGGFTGTQTKHMWIARPASESCCKDQILPVNWVAITQGASTETNFQIMPNDRLFISNSRLVQLDNFIGDAIGPFERLFGFTLVGTQMVQQFNRGPSGFNGTPGNSGSGS